jgi:tagatose-1,6-bisphosphate aldolase
MKKVEEDSCKSRAINIKSELIAQEEGGVLVGRAVWKSC